MVFANVSYQYPGVAEERFLFENNPIIGDQRFANFFKLPQEPIDGGSLDPGHVGYTTILRNGLLMAFNTLTAQWQQWGGAAGANGTDQIGGVLYRDVNTQLDGADRDYWVGSIYVGGMWNVNKLIIPEAASGATLGIVGKAVLNYTEADIRASIANLKLVRLSDEHKQ